MLRKIIITAVVLALIIFLLLVIYSSVTSSQPSYNVSDFSLTDDPTIPDNLPESIVWMANHETGDLRQWEYGSTGKSSQDSGFCTRPNKGVSTDVSHSGKYSTKMAIRSWFSGSGCRQFRYPEARSGGDYYYSAWLYFPKDYKVGRWSNVMQFKGRKNEDVGEEGGSKVMWVLRMMNRKDGSPHFQLHWDDDNGLSGPTSDGPTAVDKYFDQDVTNIPIKKWVHVEMFVKQSEEFDGQIIVWQDGVEIFNIQNIRTKMPDGFISWSVNSYGGYITPDPYTIYVDDAAVSTERVGPEFVF